MNKTIKTAIQVIAFLAMSLIIACHSSDPTPGKTANDIETSSDKNSPSAEATAYKLEKDTGWGYKVVVNGKQYINQRQIPAIQGIKTFATQSDAQKVGDFVASQIKKGEPFGVSDSLLRAMNIKF